MMFCVVACSAIFSLFPTEVKHFLCFSVFYPLNILSYDLARVGVIVLLVCPTAVALSVITVVVGCLWPISLMVVPGGTAILQL